jgi:hypothetical protein
MAARHIIHFHSSELCREKHLYTMPSSTFLLPKVVLKISSNRKIITVMGLTFEKETLNPLPGS